MNDSYGRKQRLSQSPAELTIQGINSQHQVTIDLNSLLELIDTYMTVVPNEKRTLATSLKVLRLHDKFKELLLKETEANERYIEMKTMGKPVSSDTP